MAVTEISIAIVKDNNAYLICLRPDDVHQGGKWEFPGGKVESNESPAQAMCRELKEEVGITAVDYQLFEAKFFDYGDKQLRLNFYLVSAYSGRAQGKEGQPVKWVSKAQLAEYQFPEANKSIIAKL
ncbi:8-oxo-dGTP diphosphatase MutT [Psychromonas aquimarina]|uniref:8-oxo-dGTP diphosphatase MutT n=1 Tax=Psychromonas aquimarina TaxID=444919 RepID=UPI00040F11DB|nr:8-oxo-dGTP diphosphatase MutT [Psychromonas aquimarina]